MPNARVACAIVLALVLLTSCATGATDNHPSAKGGTVTIRLQGDFGHLDPQSPSIAQGGVVTYALYDNLLFVDAHGQLIPYLVTSWKLSPTSLRFVIRSGATCADGTPINASAVKTSLDRLFTTTVAARDVGPGTYKVSADNSTNTVMIALGTPNSEAIYAFATSQGIICPGGIANATSLMTKPNGSGPFTLESAVHGDQVVLNGRPDWKWGPTNITAATPGLPQKIVYKVVGNETTAANLLLTGGLDLSLVTGPDVARLAADKSLIHKTAHSYASYFLYFNESPGRVTADPVVRQALATAVDPKAWNQVVYQGRGYVSPSLFATDSECFDPATAKLLPTPSVDRAKAILLNAGYTTDSSGKLLKNGKPLAVRLNSTPDAFGPGGQYVASQWTKMGATVDLADTDRATYNANNRTFQFDASFFPTGPALLPEQHSYIGFITGPKTPAGSNLTGVADPVVDQEYVAALGSTGAEKCKHYTKLQEALLTNYDLVPLPSPPWDYFSRGIDFVPFGGNNVLPQYIRRVSNP